MKIGIPKALHYYYHGNMWKCFFETLGFEVVTTDTNKDIVNRGNLVSNDEMCLSYKIYLGHVDYLKDKCDYIFIPIIDNYGLKEQMCANYLSLYDVVNNLFDVKILDVKIDYVKKNSEFKSYIELAKKLGVNKKTAARVYLISKIKNSKDKKRIIIDNINKLNSTKKKILLIAHSYNLHDSYISSEILNCFKNLNCEVVYSDCFESIVTNRLADSFNADLYWKYNKESIGSIILCQGLVDGIVFISAFPCGLDSLVNELVIKKIEKPYLNLVIDDLDGDRGIVTRIESFVDIIEQN